MNSLLTLLSLRGVEHLIIAQDLNILEMSPGVHRLADLPDEVKRGKDVRIGFPELIGVEKVLDAIRQGKQNNFELKGIIRLQNAASPLYIDLCIIQNIKENYPSHELMILVEDATERMVLEQSLIQGANEANLLLRTLTASKQYIDQIVTSMADALLVTTLSGKVKTMNLAAQALLEYDEAELRGQPISTVIKEVGRGGVTPPVRPWGVGGDEEDKGDKGINLHYSLSSPSSPTNVQTFRRNVSSPLPTPLIKEVETVCYTKSGKIIPVAFSCSMVQTEIEYFQGYVYILRDITERKQAELAKQEFLAMISHEVRTPMTSVTGMASLLLDTELTAGQRNFVEIIYSSGDALLKIINDFLDFSKIESDKQELEEQPFALQSCINEAFYILSPTAREKGLKLTFIDTSDLSTMIMGDINRLRQILVNLLSNAIKFTEAGSIEVSVKANKINSRQYGKNSYEIQFAVRDTGIGIPRDRLDRLFKAFSQVDSSITRQYGGTGLGLAICKKLSELMGGRIWVESEPGVGSIFYFTITARSF